MAALAARRADMHSCGQPLSESADPRNEGRYRVGPPYRCHACTAISIAKQDYKDAKHPHALLFSADLRPR